MTSAGPELVDREVNDSSGFWIYGVVPADLEVPPGLQGVDGSPVQLVADEQLAVVVGPVHLERPRGRRAEVTDHADVLAALAGVGPVLPVRFGSIVGSLDDVRVDFLEAQAEVLVDLLSQLAGRTQLNLRATYIEEVVLGEIVQQYPEVAELRRRTRDVPEEASYADRARLGELVARAIDDKRGGDLPYLMDAIEPFVAGSVAREGGGIDHLLDIALLVDHERTAELEDRLEALAEALHERIRLRLVGPVPPYDFVGDL